DAHGALTKPMELQDVLICEPPADLLQWPIGALAHHVPGNPAEGVELASPVNARMAGTNLFDQGRTRPGHANDEDRQLRHIPPMTLVSKVLERVAGNQNINRARESPGMKRIDGPWPIAPHQIVGHCVARKSLVETASIIKQPAKGETGC